MLKFRNRYGFTLIELVMVLAIAGLIMVIVFVAVGHAQESRRDAQRQQDANQVLSIAETYASQNGGNYCTTTAGTYFCGSAYPPGSPANDPQGNAYQPTTVGPGYMKYSGPGHTCNANNTFTIGTNTQVAVRVWLELSGVVCYHN